MWYKWEQGTWGISWGDEFFREGSGCGVLTEIVPSLWSQGDWVEWRAWLLKTQRRLKHGLKVVIWFVCTAAWVTYDTTPKWHGPSVKSFVKPNCYFKTFRQHEGGVFHPRYCHHLGVKCCVIVSCSVVEPSFPLQQRTGKQILWVTMQIRWWVWSFKGRAPLGTVSDCIELLNFE